MNPSMQSGFVWFFTLPSVVLLSVGSVTVFTILIALVSVLRRWGES